MRGSILLSKNKKYLTRNDGQPFFWLADTWWYGLSDRISLADFKKLLDRRKAQGFTVLLLVVGSPPEIPFNSEQSCANGVKPWTDSFDPNSDYFEAITKKIELVIAEGLLPCLVSNWGPHIQIVGDEKMLNFWQQMISHFAQYPVVWCLTGEVDLRATLMNESPIINHLKRFIPSELKNGWRKIKNIGKKSAMRSIQVADQQAAWARIATSIPRLDPHHHLLTVHPHTLRSARELFPEASWLDINGIQSGHSLDRLEFLVSQPLKEAHNQVFINLEPWYEGILGKFGALAQRQGFWLSVLAGAKGHTYGADGLWNFRKPQDHFLNHWGTQSWEEAANLPGAVHLGLGKKWLNSCDWWTLQPVFTALNLNWSPHQLQYPLTARTKNQNFISYFPQTSDLAALEWQVPGSWQATWLSPETCQPIKTQPLQTHTLFHIPAELESDALLWVRPKE